MNEIESVINEGICLASAFAGDTVGKPEHHMISAILQLLTDAVEGKHKAGKWKLLYKGAWTAIEIDRQTK